MIGLTALVLLWTHGLGTPSLTAAPVFAPPNAATSELSLRADRLGLDRPRDGWRSFVGQTGAPAAEEAPAATSADTPSPATTCDLDCETAQEDARLARYVLRRRARLLRVHRAFAIAAWSALLVTEVLGTIQAVNQPTWFGDGACSRDPEAFGCHQSSLITGLHETFAFTTTALYTTAGILAVAAPDPENAADGDGRAPRTLRLHKTLAWVHGAGMILLPLLGVITAHPQIVGVSPDAQADFGRAMRTVHAVVGYTTFAALSFSAYLEL